MPLNKNEQEQPLIDGDNFTPSSDAAGTAISLLTALSRAYKAMAADDDGTMLAGLVEIDNEPAAHIPIG
jgi:hypothetical protein